MLAAASAAALLFSGCGRAPEGKSATARPAAEKKAASPAAKPSPAQLARERFDQKQYGRVVPTLGADRSAAALDVCLEMLTLDPQHIVSRNHVVELLEQWPDQHARIAAALVAHAPRAYWGKELESIARVLVKWGQPEQAVEYARYFAGQRDVSLAKAAAAGLEKLLSPAVVGVLLAALPEVPPTPAARAEHDHARLTLTLLTRVSSPDTALPTLITYLKSGAHNLIGPAAIAIGRVGNEQAVITLESLAADRRNATLAQRCAEGLWHAPHPRARTRVAAALAGSDPIVALEVAAALVASATPADATLFARAINTPQPHLRQRLIFGLPRVLPEGGSALVPAATAALAARRPRTALLIAEVIGNVELAARARQAFGALAGQHPDGADLGRWLGQRKEDVETAYPGLIEGQESRSGVAGTTLITQYGAHFLRTPEDTLRVYRNQAQRVVRIQAHKKYADPVAGVRLGDNADMIWELHGASDDKIISWLDYELESGGRPVRFTYHLDSKRNVRAIDVREPEKKR